jgi:hypothetical protein
MSYQVDSYGNVYFPAGIFLASIPATTGTQVRVLVPGPGGSISSATISQLISQSGGSLVSSVFGRTGDIMPTRDDYNSTFVKEGSNLYFTNSRSRASISLSTTGSTGPATYDPITGIINVPQYQSDLNGVSSFNTRTGAITLNAQDVTTALTYTPIAIETDPVWTSQKILYYTKVETESYVTTQISNLVDSAPTALNTLNELAAALGDDANFSTTVTNLIGTKQAQLNGTGFVKISGTTISYDNSTYYLASNPSGYITGNQNITLNGDITGSGTTSIATTIANNAVTTSKINNGAVTAAKMATFGAGEGFFWAANTDGASIVFESTSDGASGGRALSNLLIALTDNGDEGLKVTTTGSELLYVNINQFQYKGNNVWHAGNLTNLNQLANGPGYITGYTETDTLSSVTTRGATTSTQIISTSSAGDGSIISRNDGSGTSWRGRIGHWNATADKSVWLATYNGLAIVGAHNFALNAWADLLVNCVDNSGSGGIVRLAASAFVGSNAIWHAGNLTNLNQLSNGPGYITSSSLSGYLPLSGGSLSGVLTTNAQLAVADNIVIYGNNKQIQWNAAASSDLFISCIPNTRTIEIRNGNAGSPNYAACGLITGYATFTANVTVQGNLTVSSSNTTGGGIILADDGDIVDLNDAYCSMRFSAGVRIFSANRGGSPVITLSNTGTISGSSVAAGNITTGVNGSHIVQRDANGYIYANHINFNTTETENPVINSFITSNGDGWSRKSTLAHVKNSIRGIADGSWAISAAQLGGLSLQQVVRYHSGSDFANGTLVITDINGAATYGDSFVMEVTGKSYGSGPAPFGLLLEGYIYADTFINVGAISYGSWFPGPIRILNYNGNLAFWWPRGSYWNSFSVYVREAGGGSSNRVTSIIDSTEPSVSKKVSVGVIQSLNSSNYNSYSPTLTGGGASGTWGITITGNSSNITAHTINQSVGTGNTPSFAGAILGCGVSTGRSGYAPGTLNLILTSSTAGSDGLCGIDFRSGNNYPSDGASIYYENSQTGSGEISRLVFRVENDLNDSILMRAGYHVYNARTVDNASQGVDNPVFRWQYLDSNRMSLDSSGNLVCSGDITAYGSPSDARLKTIKETVQDPIDKIMKISGYRFDWNDINTTLNVKEDVGVIAQEIAEVLPELTRTNENGYMSVRYQGLTALLIEGMKEQQLQIEELKNEIKELKNK